MLHLPDNFESYNQARKNGFLKMKELKESGQRIVGTFCSFVPTELVEAAGGTVVSLCASSEEPIAAAEANLPRNLCPLIKASYGFALTDTCPYFYFADYVVGETTCDGKKKMFELMDEIKDTYAIEAYHVKKTCQAKGIPYLNIETDYSTADCGQINTRLEAFLETIE